MNSTDILQLINAKLIDAEFSTGYDAKCMITNAFFDIVKTNYPDINLEHFSRWYYTEQSCRVDYKGWPLCYFSYTRALVRKENRDTYGIRPKKLIYGFNHIDVKLSGQTEDLKAVINEIEDTINHFAQQQDEENNLCRCIYDTIKEKYPDLGDKKLYKLLAHLVANFKKIVGEQP